MIDRNPAAALDRALLAELRRVADPAKAAPMQRYMKSAMPFLGVQTPALRSICREAFAKYPLETATQWRAACLHIWRNAQYREQRHAAIALTGYRLYTAHQTLATLPMYDEMIVNGAWWDYVDEIASHRLGPLLRAFPKPMSRKMLQ